MIAWNVRSGWRMVLNMPEPHAPERAYEPPVEPRFRILAVDGGGIRGLIPALVLERLDALIRERSPGATLASSFDLIAGTSTGGLITLALTTPGPDGNPAMTPADMVELYSGPEARRIFDRPPLEQVPGLGYASELIDPKYGLDELEKVLVDRFGERVVSEALSDVLISAYDMHDREPRFFKRWGSSGATRVVDAGLATSAAPTYFPSHELDGAALVDGGVFVNNPAIAATIEALKRTEGEPIRPDDLLVVSVGTGHHERGYDPGKVAGWGALGWILPTGGGEPPVIGAMLDGQSDSTDHWAHILLNHIPGNEVARGPEMGAGPRYYRWQVELARPLPLDGVKPEDIARLRAAGEALIADREQELAAVAAALAAGPP